MNKDIIKIATWNISEGVTISWNLNDGVKEKNNNGDTEIIKQVIEKINVYDLDIVCFQEFPIQIAGGFLMEELIFNKTKLKYCSMHETGPSFLFDGGRVGVAIFSKYPIIAEEKTYFNNPNFTKLSKSGEVYRSFDKGIILAKINNNDRVINVINGHAIGFGPFDKKAEDFPESYKPLSDLINKVYNSSEPLIVCGDFNTECLFELIPEIDKKVIDVIEGTTTPDGIMEGKVYKNGRKLDYILISDNFKICNVEKIENLSDHFLCIASVLIP